MKDSVIRVACLMLMAMLLQACISPRAFIETTEEEQVMMAESLKPGMRVAVVAIDEWGHCKFSSSWAGYGFEEILLPGVAAATSEMLNLDAEVLDYHPGSDWQMERERAEGIVLGCDITPEFFKSKGFGAYLLILLHQQYRGTDVFNTEGRVTYRPSFQLYSVPKTGEGRYIMRTTSDAVSCAVTYETSMVYITTDVELKEPDRCAFEFEETYRAQLAKRGYGGG